VARETVPVIVNIVAVVPVHVFIVWKEPLLAFLGVEPIVPPVGLKEQELVNARLIAVLAVMPRLVFLNIKRIVIADAELVVGEKLMVVVTKIIAVVIGNVKGLIV